MARDWILAGHIICRGRPLNSFDVSRAAKSIDPDQTFAKKYFLNVPAEDKTDKFSCDLRFFGLGDFISKLYCISLKRLCLRQFIAAFTVCQSASFRRKYKG